MLYDMVRVVGESEKSKLVRVTRKFVGRFRIREDIGSGFFITKSSFPWSISIISVDPSTRTVNLERPRFYNLARRLARAYENEIRREFNFKETYLESVPID